MITLIFATNNQHKVDEIKPLVGNKFNIITLADAGITQDIPEPHPTIEANALEKARVIFSLTNNHVFGEDTGLEVAALQGEPGVKSARYAGEQKSFSANIEKLLYNLQPFNNTTAQFKTVIALIFNNQEYVFEGICKGRIVNEPKGTLGFGYDPIFRPDGATKTFAEMSAAEKNTYSHRAKATQQLINFLQQQTV
jgi:XTP/dITP diphosphohydrolase